MSDSTQDCPTVADSIQQYLSRWSAAWNEFWFRPRDPFVLGLIRIVVGCIVFYTHLVWTKELSTFLGADGLLPNEYRDHFFANAYAWSHLGWFESSTTLMIAHVAGLVVMAMFTIGLWTRWTAIATAFLVISYANRATGALFGLDQINAFLCIYLAIGNCGGAWSLDQQRRKKQESRAGEGGDPWTNIATRLIQVHMCIVYLFAAIGKLQGDTWFNGEAIWGALASYEYQTLDMTWLSGHMTLVAILTLGTLAWELVYAALVWPKLTRPIVLLLAIPMHLGIGLCMGMMPFALIMLAGNLAFIEPAWLIQWKRNWRTQ